MQKQARTSLGRTLNLGKKIKRITTKKKQKLIELSDATRRATGEQGRWGGGGGMPRLEGWKRGGGFKYGHVGAGFPCHSGQFPKCEGVPETLEGGKSQNMIDQRRTRRVGLEAPGRRRN